MDTDKRSAKSYEATRTMYRTQTHMDLTKSVKAGQPNFQKKKKKKMVLSIGEKIIRLTDHVKKKNIQFFLVIEQNYDGP